MLKLNGLERFRYFRIDLFRGGEYSVSDLLLVCRGSCDFGSAPDKMSFEAVIRFLRSIIADEHEKPSLVVIKSRDAVFARTHDVALKDVLRRR